MTINLSLPQTESEIKPRITVIGVGGAGGNAVNNMISAALEGVEFIVANTDSQALSQSLADRRVQLGITITQGLGAGARPEVGRQAAEEALPEILQLLDGANMVFVTAGMGGGTGTGAAPVIAAAAREQGILTIGVVTKPFHFEGRRRMQSAEQGITELEKVVDTLIVIPNQNLFKIANEKTTFADAFKMADDVLHMGVRGVTDLMVMPGLINLDFADIRTVMGEMGKAMMGTGEAEGPDRSRVAAESAISNPLLEDHSMKGAKGVLINITGGLDMTLHEVDEAANRIREEVDGDANIIFGSTFDATMDGRMRVSVVATGIAALAAQQPAPNYLSLDMNRPIQTGQPALSRPVAPPVGRVAMPTAATAAPAPAMPAAPVAPPVSVAPPAPPVVAPAPVAAAPVAPIVASMPTPAPAYEAPVEAPVMVAPPVEVAPAPAPVQAPVAVAPAPVQAPAPAPAAPQRPLVDENDWRISRPSTTKTPVRAEHVTRPMAARPAADNRAPNLFQRITGAFSAPKPTPATGAAPVEPVAARPAAPENVVAVAPKAPVARPAPVQTSISLEVTERAKPARDDDDLQIPAFLRRQAN
ncbi:cell division protein FtsZ [Reyranella sp.]|jgi:cell division protein FtsZ|uniref:cell division protein FtsZ n=1 Tax=Reyranella sp. TaxID=1929291 RepID=UPI000BDAF404|nr:cell division protein FtsZ [Reyranella sp.]OYY41327.1 MAG: cell division protein FtsZ [Rhodospirillales bacterium 35-66-84]OYZ93525.1 MAG: cell division protein FtsZ [Rhodospirillales bacterium 24-66-33]OZB21780.1 MAG: cell division protein FtsZ [Rhodospirillales bacterium 39-66-50]HQS16305.1 cell division protein FtsZ [Reyranella sp.]HQT12136.1 cell division protein FtsZ [Reyranella sp.]